MFAKYSRELLFCIYQLLLKNPLPRIFCKLQGGGGTACTAVHHISFAGWTLSPDMVLGWCAVCG